MAAPSSVSYVLQGQRHAMPLSCVLSKLRPHGCHTGPKHVFDSYLDYVWPLPCIIQKKIESEYAIVVTKVNILSLTEIRSSMKNCDSYIDDAFLVRCNLERLRLPFHLPLASLTPLTSRWRLLTFPIRNLSTLQATLNQSII